MKPTPRTLFPLLFALGCSTADPLAADLSPALPGDGALEADLRPAQPPDLSGACELPADNRLIDEVSAGPVQIMTQAGPPPIYTATVDATAGGSIEQGQNIGFTVNVINIIGNYILIFGKFGFPALGVVGSATATTIAFTTGALLGLGLLISRRLIIRLHSGHALPRPATIRRILAIGYPAALILAKLIRSRWREDKIGAITSYLPGTAEAPPQPLVTTYVGTLEKVEGFGKQLQVEAERRGLRQRAGSARRYPRRSPAAPRCIRQRRWLHDRPWIDHSRGEHTLT